MNDDILVCRCEEITVGEVKEAIRKGARDVTGVKRRTRAGMGVCQGSSCERLIQMIIRQELGQTEVAPGTDRPPAVPITFGSLGGDHH